MIYLTVSATGVAVAPLTLGQDSTRLIEEDAETVEVAAYDELNLPPAPTYASLTQ